MKNPDDEPEPDPDDDGLVAYLDGELDEAEARKVESKLALDPAARTKADEYKKAFDLLDYLPKREPSAGFTERTLTRVQPALAPGSAGSQSFTLNLGDAPRRRVWPSAVAWAVAAALACGAGFAAHRLAHQPAVAKADAFDQADLPMIHDLPYLLGADDLDFLRKLHATEAFDDDPADPPARPAADLGRVSLDEQRKLIELFLSFSPSRQAQLRTLHHQLAALPAKERADLRGTMEAYAAWLDRRPDAERHEVLSAPDGPARLAAIAYLRERHWREALPQTQKAMLARASSAKETLGLVGELKDREHSRRQEWELAKRQWQPNTGDQPKTWPFSDPNLAAPLDQFVKGVLGVDLAAVERKGDRLDFTMPAACRLTREELNELKIKHDAATKDGYWGVYAECLYRLADRHPSLPKPGKGSPITAIGQLPTGYLRFVPKEGALAKPKRFELTAGKWPDFALAVHDAARPAKLETSHPLGPCKPGEFTDEVNAFLTGRLLPALADPKAKKEQDALVAAEGKWPEYPRLMMETAKARNLPVPGVSLPGDPDLWARFYKPAPAK